MTIVVPCSCAIGILGCLTLYQMRLAKTFTGNYKDKLYYFYSHLITLIPIIIFAFMIINELVLGESQTLELFYVEWVFTTPLILINLARLIRIPLHHYVLLTYLDMSMILSGYISYIVSNPITAICFFVYGCATFCGIFVYYIKKLKSYNKRLSKLALAPTSIYRDSIRYRIYRVLLFSIVVSWILYPITHILQKFGILSVQEASTAFICLDVGTKGIFTNLLLGIREVYRTPSSLLGRLTQKVFRIHPLEVKLSENQLEEIVSDAKQEAPGGITIHADDYETHVSHVIRIESEQAMDRELASTEEEKAIGLSISARKTSVYEPTLSSIHEDQGGSIELPNA